MPIKPLSKDAVHQICSNQVIISLSAALKELVENSLDAKASAIEVYLDNYGSESIEVVDNGEGILPHNFTSICLKHFTSKISEFSDLQELGTFGFRGEALSSMCAVSDVSILTRHVLEEVGYCLEYDTSGELVKKSPCAAQTGTRISIKNIFLNVPVRRIELMKTLKKEFNKLLQILYGYCIIRYDVRFQCFLLPKKDKSLLINTTETSSMRDVIISLFGSKSINCLIPITKCDYHDVTSCSTKQISSEYFGQIELTGFVSAPEPGAGRTNSERQFFFLNSRPCDYPALSRLLNELYHEYDRNHFPFVVLSINTRANQLDVNLTPDKRSILLHSEQLVFDIIRCSVAKLFNQYVTTFSTCVNLTAKCKLSNSPPKVVNNNKAVTPRKHMFPHKSPNKQHLLTKYTPPKKLDTPFLSSQTTPTAPVSFSSYRVDHMPDRVSRESIISVDIADIRRAVNSKNCSNSRCFDNLFSARINPEQNDRAEAELRKELSKDSFNSMEIVGQFNLGFIITKLSNHLFIIDQHATDEKYRFEVLRSSEHISSQPLIAPLPLELSVTTELVIMDNLNTFEMNGFDIVVDENNSPTHRLKLLALPMSKGWIFGEGDIEEMALLLQDRPGVLCRPTKIRSMFASRACRSAVMIGTALTLKEMERFVRNMAQMEQPWQCPHGRPTMRHLTTLI